MKKRVLSIVCVVALVATMISAAAIYAIGTDTTPLGDTTAFSFDGSTFVQADWTATNVAPTHSSSGLTLANTSGTNYATVKYKDSYNLTNGFTLEYAAKGRKYYDNIIEGLYYVGVQVGNITVAMDRFIKPVIMVDGTVKATGNNIITFDSNNPTYDSSKSEAHNIRRWISNSGGEGAIADIKYTVTYDATAKTLTYTKHQGSDEVFTLTYTDTANLIDVTSADVALYHNNSNTMGATYKSISLKGAAAATPPPTPTVLIGTGYEFNATTAPVASDWTFSHTSSTVGGDYVKLDGGNVYSYLTATYKDTFILTDGFTLTYTANGNSTKNYTNGNTYLGATVGNITAGIEVTNSNKEAAVLVIYIDGTAVATSDIIFDSTHSAWDANKANNQNMEYYFGAYFGGKSPVFTLNYDKDTKTITYSLVINETEQGKVSYVDANNTAALTDASLVLKSHSTWAITAGYKNLKLVGAPCPGHEYDDDNDTTCNKCGEVRDVNSGFGDGGQGGGDPAPEKGEALTSTWSPEFTDIDWTGDTSAFKSGRFTMTGGSEDVHKTIWSVKDFDLSAGFDFKGTLTMKNGHDNYYGEWCSAFFGTDAKNLELRIKNDGSRGSSEKIKTYTAFLLYNGQELAKTSLAGAPNGEYELTYKNGKVSVSLGGVVLNWTLADTTTANEVAVTADLNKAKLGLMLTGNYGPENGREWKNISLAPLPTNSGDQGGEGGEGDPSNPVTKGEALTETWAPETIDESDWTGHTDKILGGKFKLKGTEKTPYTIWTAKKYDFSNGVGFKGTLVMKNGYNNFYEEYCSLYLGNEQKNIELRVQNKGADKIVTIDEEDGEEIVTNTNKGYELHVVCNGIILATYDLEMDPDNDYELLYKDGRVQVKMNDEIVKFVLADGTKVRSLPVDIDLSNAKAGLMLSGNNGPKNGRVWSNVALTPLAADVDLDAVIKGETLDLFAPEKFLEEDWEDSEDMFTDEGEFTIVSGNGHKTVWTAKSYDLSGGFKFKGTLAMKNAYNNFYGEWCSVYFGNENDNLELRIRNDSESNAEGEKDNTYTAYILYAGVELASADLLTLPNGEYEVTYKDGKVNVSLGGVAITWTLADGSESGVVTIPDPELYNAKLGLRLTGNYGPRNSRRWSAISLASLSSKGAAVTGDARNLVIPACVMLVSAVAVAFVLIRKKSRA